MLGHSGQWGVDVTEDVLQDDFSGRKWQVEVRPASEVRQGMMDSKTKQKETARDAKCKRDENKALMAIDTLTAKSVATTIKQIRGIAKLGREAVEDAVLRLVNKRLP
jgi:uncharacterized membrane protein